MSLFASWMAANDPGAIGLLGPDDAPHFVVEAVPGEVGTQHQKRPFPGGKSEARVVKPLLRSHHGRTL